MKLIENMAPGKIIALGFFAVILLGSILLSLPIASVNREFTNFLDCFFTATSATCITGLTTFSTAHHWSLFGQLVIIFMIQIGGLGFMAFVTLVFMILGKRITLKNRIVIRESYNIDDRKGIVRFIRYICKFTFSVELIGAFVLAFWFVPNYGAVKGIYYAVFHSISAFCNAGFDLIGDSSLLPLYNNYLVLITLMALIVIGGLGFPVVTDLYCAIKNVLFNKFSIRRALHSMKLHSKIVISTSVILIFFGAIFFFVSEYNNPYTMGFMTIPEKILNSFFQSITLRTAGFLTVNQGSLNFASKFIGVLLMFVGGSPASTAGGAKTVTIAVIVLSVVSLIKGDNDIRVFRRTIPFTTVIKSLSVLIILMSIAFISVIILSITEVGSADLFSSTDLFYEVFSAIDTVGLTAGLTPLLTPIGKIVIILCMYIGRIGPITMAMLFISNNKKADIHYPEGKILVG